MTRFEHSVVIERPLEEVWAYVDASRQRPGLAGSGHRGPQRGGRADRGRQPRSSEVVAVPRPAVRDHLGGDRARADAAGPRCGPSSGPGRRWTGSYASSRTDGGTRFTMEGEVEAHGFFRLAEPVFARMARREWESSCETLKELLEAGRRRPLRRNDSRTAPP